MRRLSFRYFYKIIMPGADCGLGIIGSGFWLIYWLVNCLDGVSQLKEKIFVYNLFFVQTFFADDGDILSLAASVVGRLKESKVSTADVLLLLLLIFSRQACAAARRARQRRGGRIRHCFCHEGIRTDAH